MDQQASFRACTSHRLHLAAIGRNWHRPARNRVNITRRAKSRFSHSESSVRRIQRAIEKVTSQFGHPLAAERIQLMRTEQNKPATAQSQSPWNKDASLRVPCSARLGDLTSSDCPDNKRYSFAHHATRSVFKPISPEPQERAAPKHPTHHPQHPTAATNPNDRNTPGPQQPSNQQNESQSRPAPSSPCQSEECLEKRPCGCRWPTIRWRPTHHLPSAV